MTEISEIPGARRSPVDPLAFTLALVLAPLVFALLFFWVLLIPVFAVIFGAIPYLFFGTPIFLWGLGRGLEGVVAGAGLGFLAWIAMCAALGIGWAAGRVEQDLLALLAYFGAGMAPGWGAAFALLYGRLRRAHYRISI